MGEFSKIEWTDHTFNPWVGCSKVSPACDHCYAEGWAKRTGHPELWQGERRRTSAENWRKPIKWNRDAEATGRRARVFAASLADWLDNQIPEEWRSDLANLIGSTPWLDWLLLTKRPQNYAKLASWGMGTLPENVWLGITAEDQAHFDQRWRFIHDIPASVRFVSYEPALGALTLTVNKPDWIICGGESGPGARPMDLEWARSIRDQCAASGVAFFMKQIDKKQPIPYDLLVRQFPRAA